MKKKLLGTKYKILTDVQLSIWQPLNNDTSNT